VGIRQRFPAERVDRPAQETIQPITAALAARPVRRAPLRRPAGRRISLPPEAALAALFGLLILAGVLLLVWLPLRPRGRLALIDALFTAVSAVTLTGLTTVPIPDLTPLGQAVVLLLTQAGGMAVICASTLLLAQPGRRRSSVSGRIVAERWVEVREIDPRRLVLGIVAAVVGLEAAGALALYGLFRALPLPAPAFAAAFHAVSAFCNAGFSTLEGGLRPLSSSGSALAVIAVLALLGGLGTVALRDLALRLSGRSRTLSLHTRIVLAASSLLIAAAALLYLLFDGARLRPGSAAGPGLPAALFHAVNARSAGFPLADPAGMTPAGWALTVLLMLVGGAPGSAAGGLKLTTVVLVLLVAARGLREEDPGRPAGRRLYIPVRAGTSDLLSSGRRIPMEARVFAAVFLLRALVLWALGVLLLAGVESLAGSPAGPSFGDLVFEATSAFTSAGLSTGITATLSAAGKAAVVLIMLAGRVGLLMVVARMSGRRPPARAGGRIVRSPREVLIG
jgi:trk system potassium uptake protein TrkH